MMKWLILRWIIRSLIRGSRLTYENNYVRMFGIVREEWHDVFTEDNKPTRNQHLQELFDESVAPWFSETRTYHSVTSKPTVGDHQ